MSLRVWLPLDGDLRNLGCSNYTISVFRGTETYDNAGKIGKCFYAHGTNALKIQNILPDIYNYSAYSLCAWCYVEAQNTTHSGSGIISGGNWNSQLLNLAMSSWSSDHYTQLRISGTNWNRTYNYNFYKNTWYHIVVCDDGVHTYAYVNGNLIGDTAASFLPTSIEGSDICIGGATYYSGMQFFGKINDVRIYDHCLSAAEVKEIAQGLVLHYKLDDLENGVLDSSGYGHHGTILGTATLSSDTAHYNSSITLPSGANAINCGRGGMMTDSITVNIWIKATGWGNPVSCTEGGGWNFEADGDYFRFPVYISGVGYKYGKSTHTRAQICNGQWHMLTGIYDKINQKVQIYVDGQLDNDYAAGTSNNIGYNGSNVIWIGAEASSSATAYASRQMVGSFSDFRIYCTALNADAIRQLYEVGAKIDNKQNLHTFELVEPATRISINKQGQILCNELEETSATKFFKINQIIETNNLIEL